MTAARSLPLLRSTGKPFIAGGTVVLVLLILFVQSIWRQEETRTTKSFDDDIRDLWTDHIKLSPIHPNDRYGFQEMGFRTAMYARSLAHSDVSSLRHAARLEASLFGFLRGGLNESRHSAKTRLAQHHGQHISQDDDAPYPIPSSRMEQLGKHASRLASPIPSFRQKRKQRGIVTIVERDTLRACVELMTTLRYGLKETMPIEIFYYGTDDMPELLEEAFSMMPGIRTIDLDSIHLFSQDGFDALEIRNMTQKRNMALQSLALFASDFDEIFFAAPGTLFLRNLSDMLSEQGYKESGTLFFHESNTIQLADSQRFLNFLRQQFDQGEPTLNLAESPFYNFGLNHYQDPRVLLLDKSRPTVFAAILFNVWLHLPQVRELIWHAHFPECLTETIWLAFELTKAPYFFEPAYPGAIGHFDGPIDELPWEPTICPAHALHFIGRKSYASRDGKPMWVDGGLKLFPHHPEYLSIQAWSARGRWEQTNMGMCLKGADAKSSDRHELGDVFTKYRTIDKTFEGILRPIFDRHHLTNL